jgi:hypothetical protein
MEDFISAAGMLCPPAESKMKCVPITVLFVSSRDNENSIAEHNCIHMNITWIQNKPLLCVKLQS